MEKNKIDSITKKLLDIKEANQDKDVKKHGCLYYLILFIFSFPLGILILSMICFSVLLIWEMHLVSLAGFTPSFFNLVAAFYIMCLFRLPAAIMQQSEAKLETFSKLIGYSLAVAIYCSIFVGMSWLFTLFV